VVFFCGLSSDTLGCLSVCCRSGGVFLTLSALLVHTILCPSASRKLTGLLSAMVYRFQLCGFLLFEYDGESGDINLPIAEELYLAPKLSRPDSESRSLPVNL
jgi:hypothetical protein